MTFTAPPGISSAWISITSGCILSAGLKADQYYAGVTFRATAPGKLSFDVNDTVKGDNEGSFKVYVFVRPGGTTPDARIKDIE